MIKAGTRAGRAVGCSGGMLVALALLIGALGGGGGCRHNDSSGGGAATVGAAPSATPQPTNSMKLASGPATLNYLLGAGGQIHVVDLDTGKTIATATAPLQAVITVDQSRGVIVANNVITAGPLPVGHRYEIWLDHK